MNLEAIDANIDQCYNATIVEKRSWTEQMQKSTVGFPTGDGQALEKLNKK